MQVKQTDIVNTAIEDGHAYGWLCDDYRGSTLRPGHSATEEVRQGNQGHNLKITCSTEMYTCTVDRVSLLVAIVRLFLIGK